jgi:hypothetical protein
MLRSFAKCEGFLPYGSNGSIVRSFSDGGRKPQPDTFMFRHISRTRRNPNIAPETETHEAAWLAELDGLSSRATVVSHGAEPRGVFASLWPL